MTLVGISVKKLVLFRLGSVLKKLPSTEPLKQQITMQINTIKIISQVFNIWRANFSSIVHTLFTILVNNYAPILQFLCRNDIYCYLLLFDKVVVNDRLIFLKEDSVHTTYQTDFVLHPIAMFNPVTKSLILQRLIVFCLLFLNVTVDCLWIA